MVRSIESLYGAAYARTADLGLHPDVFWANVAPGQDVAWSATMSNQLGGSRLGLPSELARGMSSSNDARALKYDDLLRKSLAVKPGEDLSRATRARRLTELDVVGFLAVVSLAIPDVAEAQGYRRGTPFLTVVGAPCVAERGQSVTGPSVWPSLGGSPSRLLPGDLASPEGLLYPLAGTMVHDSRRASATRETWLKHPLTLWSLSEENLDLVLDYSDRAVVPPDPVLNTFPFWGSGEQFFNEALSRELVSPAPGALFDTSRRLVAIPKFMLLSGDFQLPIGQVWSCAIGPAGFKQSLRELAGGTDPSIGDWLDHPMLREFFAAAARDPFSLATDWIWAEHMATATTQAAATAPLCFRYPILGIGFQCHRDFLLATLPPNVRRHFEKYERDAQQATFQHATVYMGGAHLAKLADLWHWRRPARTNWKVSMGLATYIATPCDPVGHDGYMRFAIKDEDPLTPRPWTTRRQAADQIAFADPTMEVDDDLASDFLRAIATGGASPRRAQLTSPGPPAIVRPLFPSVQEAASLIRLAAATSADELPAPTITGAAQPLVGTAAGAAGTAALSWHSAAGGLRGGRSSPPLYRLSPPPPSEASFLWPASTFPSVAPSQPARSPPFEGPDPGPAFNLTLAVDSSDSRTRGFTMMSLLLVIHDPGAICWTQSDDVIPPEAALFPMQLADQWTQAVHIPPKGDLAIHFVSGNFRNAFSSDYFQDAPKCNSAFFDVRVLPLFAKGLWQFDLLQRLEPDDYKSAFGIQHFLLMLPGSQYPPLIPERGLTLLELKSLLTLIRGFFAQATQSREVIRQQRENPFESCLLAQHLGHLATIMTTRLFNTTMESKPCECSIMVLNYLAQLFEIFFRWISSAPEIHLGRTTGQANVPMVAGCVFGPNGREGALLDKLREWREGSTNVLNSIGSLGFIGAIAAEMPAFLFQAPRQVTSGVPHIPRKNLKRGLGGPPLVPPLGNSLVSAAALAASQAAAVLGKQPVFAAASIPILDWAAGCDQATRAKPVSAILLQIRKDDATVSAPTFFDVAESDPSKARKQVCFAFCLRGGRGCDGTMPAGKGRLAAASRRQRCNRAHIDLGSTSWTTGATTASYQGICAWFKCAAVLPYFAPSQAFADSPLFTG